MTGLSYDGVAGVPTAAGSQQMLKFSMSSLTLSGGTVLTVSQGSGNVVTSNSSLQFTGNVVLYVTKLCGTILGTQVCYTPQDPPGLLPSAVVLTSLRADQPLTMADSLVASDLGITGN